jgi:hypothetical protein
MPRHSHSGGGALRKLTPPEVTEEAVLLEADEVLLQGAGDVRAPVSVAEVALVLQPISVEEAVLVLLELPLSGKDAVVVLLELEEVLHELLPFVIGSESVLLEAGGGVSWMFVRRLSNLPAV